MKSFWLPHQQWGKPEKKPPGLNINPTVTKLDHFFSFYFYSDKSENQRFYIAVSTVKSLHYGENNATNDWYGHERLGKLL